MLDKIKAVEIVGKVFGDEGARVRALRQVRRRVVLIGSDAPERIGAGAGAVKCIVSTRAIMTLSWYCYSRISV